MQNDKANPNTLDLLSPVSVGGVAWNFPTGQTNYYLHTGNDFTLPANDFTIEMWVMPYYAGSGKYFLSFASSTTDNCLLLQHNGFVTADLNSWHHLVATYAKSTNQVTTYMDGTKNMNFLYTGTSAKGFCGKYTGSFVLGQEQDNVGGGFSSTQAADMAVDTVAFYGSHWDADQVSARSGECVNLHDPTLYSLWSGFTKGKVRACVRACGQGGGLVRVFVVLLVRRKDLRACSTASARRFGILESLIVVCPAPTAHTSRNPGFGWRQRRNGVHGHFPRGSRARLLCLVMSMMMIFLCPVTLPCVLPWDLSLIHI